MTLPTRHRFAPAFLLALTFALPAFGQMRVVNYNCAQLNGDALSFQQVVDALMIDDRPGFATPPWVVVFQEVNGATTANTLRARLNVAGALHGVSYTLATFTTSTQENNSAGAIALCYRSDKLVEDPAAHIDIPTGANRNCDRWRLKLIGYTAPEVSFYVYGMHLKAEDTPEDAATRNAAAQAIRTNANSLPAGARIIYCGDMNFYSNTESGYETFTANGNGRGIDPLGNGSWAGSGNAVKHTQSPCTSCLSGLVGGGLDDRFDFILYTDSLAGLTGFGQILGTYRALGNDGSHYNIALNSGNNFYYPGEIARSNLLADALHDASDHIPVVLDFRVPAIAGAQLQSTIGPVIEGANVTVPLTISNLVLGVAEGVDPLSYVAAGSGGLSGGGNGIVGPLPDADVINLSLDTSTPGAIACGALVISSGPDVQNPEIIRNASATVLRYAAPSFAPDSIQTEVLVAQDHDVDTGVQMVELDVHNVGFDAMQSLLDLDAITSRSAPFSFDGGLATNIGSTPATLSFSFDTTGLAPGLYSDNMTIDYSDEDLPGEAFGQLTIAFEFTINETKVEPCPGDTVGSDFQPPADGVVDGFDLAFLLGEWGRNPRSPADVVGSDFLPPPDGMVDGFDLAVLLGAWGPCD